MSVIIIHARSLVNSVTTQLHYWSDCEYRDNVTKIRYRPIIQSSLILERGNDSLTNPVGKTTISNLVVDNTDSHLDRYLKDIWKNRLLEVWKGEVNQSVNQMTKVGSFRIFKHPEDNGESVTFAIRDIIGILNSRPISKRYLPTTSLSASDSEPIILGQVGYVEPVAVSEDETNTGNVRQKTARYRYIDENIADSLIGATVKRILINGRQAYPSAEQYPAGSGALSWKDLRAAINLTFHSTSFHGEFTIQQNIFEDIDSATNIGFYKCITNNMTAYPSGTMMTPCTWGTSGAGYIIHAGYHWNGVYTTVPNLRFVIYPTVYESLNNGTVITFDTSQTATLSANATRDNEIIYNRELLSQDIRMDITGLTSERNWAASPGGPGSNLSQVCDVIYMLYAAYNGNYSDDYSLTSFETDMLEDIRVDFPYAAGVCLKESETFIQAMLQLLDKGYCITSSRNNELFIYKLKSVDQGDSVDHVIYNEEIISITIQDFHSKTWRSVSISTQNFPRITNSLNTNDNYKRSTTATEWRRQAHKYQRKGEYNSVKDYPEQRQFVTYNNVFVTSEAIANTVAQSLGTPYQKDIIVYDVLIHGDKDYELNDKISITYDGKMLSDGHKLKVCKIENNYSNKTTRVLLWGEPPVL